jgi:peptidoglycan hydrolase-like protein with peptidoglycan-binding domain
LGSNLVSRSRRAALRTLMVATAAAALMTGLVGTSTALADNPSADSGAMSTDIILKKGDRGSGVKAVQRKLSVTADGNFGAGTVRAVKRFQKRSGITADGIVGPATRDALKLRPFTSRSVTRKKSKSKTKVPSSGNAPAALEKIAQCESGGDITAVSSNGKYFGKYQFSKATWKANGGEGTDPSQATEAEQDRVATELYKAEGTDPWPVCGAGS